MKNLKVLKIKIYNLINLEEIFKEMCEQMSLDPKNLQKKKETFEKNIMKVVVDSIKVIESCSIRKSVQILNIRKYLSKINDLCYYLEYKKEAINSTKNI